ncbi:MAG: ABC transporter substrate-binding protein [Clostridiales bacterium]|jgi:peptide/nickel transport system substrate-binding protein|nr:ABC transporter substrate-binding protein [Clostridiales bacterium]
MKRKSHIGTKIMAFLTLAIILLAGCQASPSASAPQASAVAPQPSASASEPSVVASSAPETAEPSAEDPSQIAEPSSQPGQGGELKASYSTEPTTWDPYLSEGADVRSILFNIYEGLVKPSSNGDLVPAVAESYEISSDATTYTFILRKDGKFSDGSVLDSADVVYSLNRAKELELSSALKSVSGIEASGSNQVVITLSEPDVDFLPYLTLAILPEGVDLANDPVGTGPFILESYAAEEEIVLGRNPYYWNAGHPYLDKVTLRKTASVEATVMALQAGTIDITSLTLENYGLIDKTKFNFTERGSASVQQLNLNNIKEPFTDPKVRQAISYAVNVQEIIDLANGGLGSKAGTPVIPGLSAYYDETLESSYPTDIEKAKSLLAEAGKGEGFAFEITVPSNYAVHVNTAQIISQQLQKINVTANIVQVDWATWLSQVYQGRDFEATIISIDGSVLSPRSFLSRYVSTSGSNFFNYSSETYDTLYAEAQKELDLAKRVSLYKDLQKLLSADAANVYIQDIKTYVALSNVFEGYEDYPLYVTDFSTIKLK